MEKPEWLTTKASLELVKRHQTPAVRWEVEVGDEHAKAAGEWEEGGDLEKEKQGAKWSFDVNGRDHGCQ